MPGDLKLHVATGRESRPIVGSDTTIFPMPPRFYVSIDNAETLVLPPFTRWLRELSDRLAADKGEELHHADYYVTTNPETIRSYGRTHDCRTCRDGVARAVTMLEQDPDWPVAVGVLHWAAPMRARRGL